MSDKLTQEPHPSRPASPPPPPHSQGLSVSAQADRLGVSAGHTPQLCTWNCSHSRLAVNPHTCSHLRPAASPLATSSPAFVSSIISRGRQKAKKKKKEWCEKKESAAKERVSVSGQVWSLLRASVTVSCQWSSGEGVCIILWVTSSSQSNQCRHVNTARQIFKTY